MTKHLLTALLLIFAGCGNDDNAKLPPSNQQTNGSSADMGSTGSDTGQSSNDASNNIPDGSTPDGGLPADATVQSTTGPVAGVAAGGIVSFKGIPYAAPPVGALRFKPPQAHAPWQDTLQADAFGADCPQRNTTSNTNFGEEDCLFLNVWAPENAAGLPVMFFIHGGGFTSGSSSLPLYDGATLAGEDVVVVTINYRIGALGFLAIDELAAENGEDIAGNYGLMDQNLALHWVRDNIAGFGGDPANVTIFGESAGGVSVCSHLAMPASEGLFARGIIESGSGCDNYVRLRTGTLSQDPAVMTGATYVAAAGCDGAADVPQCLRDLAPSSIVDAMYNLTTTGLGLPPFGPNVDGVWLPDDPADRIRNQQAPDIPVMTGSNADEATIFTLVTPVPTENAYRTIINTTFGALGDEVLALYPAADYDTPKDAYNAVFSDVGFICPSLRFAGRASEGEPAWVYHFTYVPPGVRIGAFHGLELAYVFGNLEAFPSYTPNADDRALSEAMIAAWSGFAKTGNPGWDPYDRVAPAIRIFDTTIETATQIRGGRCDELVSLGIVP